MNPNDPVFPNPWGLTKREWFAGMALQGILAGREEELAGDLVLANWAIELADALIAELSKEP